MKPQSTSRLFTVISAAALVSGPLLAQAASPGTDWTTAWPTFGSAAALVLDSSIPPRLFAGTELGVARSDDGGVSWSLLAGSPRRVRAFAADPGNASRILAGSPDGLFQTTDGGAHFAASSSADTTAIAIDPSDPGTAYAGGHDAFVRKTTDGATTWTTSSIGYSNARNIAALAVDPGPSRLVLAGLAPDGIAGGYYYTPPPSLIGSSDAGHTWKVFLDDTGPAQEVSAIAFDPRANGVVYAARSGFVYRSTDDGASWTRGNLGLGSSIQSLAVDSLAPETLYAASDQAVFWTTDSGAHWAPLPAPPDPFVLGLALDSRGGFLHAATASGVYDLALRSAAPSFPCQPAADTLCLLGSRFRVHAEAWDSRTGRFVTSARAVAETDAFGYFSLPGFTGDPTLPEILVKMVDAETPPWNGDWVFFGGLTDLRYTLTITDTVTGAVRFYDNETPYCGGADTSAFAAAASPGGGPAALPPLSPSGDALSLLSARFRLTLAATNPHTGRPVTGMAIPRGDTFGYFSLPDLTGDPDLPEVFVKMIDGRGSNHSFWIFFRGMTNVAYTLTVLDTLSGDVRSYQTPGAFCGVADTSIPSDDPPPPAHPLSTLAGIVYDGGRPVGGATVSLLDASRAIRATMTADSDGSFVFRGVPAGTWLVEAESSTKRGAIGVNVPPDDEEIRVVLRYPVPDVGD